MVDALTGWLMPCGRRCAGHRAGFAEVRKAEAGQGQGDCQAGPGREVRVRAWLSAIARLRESHGASWGRVALARPSGNVLVCGGRGRGAHRGVRYVVHCFDSRGCLGRQDERRDHRRVFSHPMWALSRMEGPRVGEACVSPCRVQCRVTVLVAPRSRSCQLTVQTTRPR